MKPWRLLDSTDVPGGNHLQLWQRAEEFSIRLRDGGELMNSRAFGSERALADLVCPALAARERPRVLVGGLGLGYTLAAALAGLPATAEVVVAELLASVVQWNRDILGHLAGDPLADPRVRVQVGDVAAALRAPGSGWDAVLLDVDNGPEGVVRAGNDWLYGPSGLAVSSRALRPGGVLAVWSSHQSPAFRRRLQASGLEVEEHRVRARAPGKGSHHVVWVARAGPQRPGTQPR